jgi:hypothetical protein
MRYRTRLVTRAFIGAFGCLVAGLVLVAQRFGPDALEQGRQRYNDTIHETSRQQVFANIIRVAYNEAPLFMDVTEVDAAELIQGTLSGGESGIGGLSALQGTGPAVPTSTSAGALLTRVVGTRVGSAAGTVGYQESPTIRYQPLSGNALIQQISTPITPTSIANLFKSEWDFLPVFDFAVNSTTPNVVDNFFC